MELKEYLHILKKRWLLIISVTLTCVFVSTIVSFFLIKPTYQASISVIIGSNKDQSSSNTNQTYNDVIMYQKLVKTYSEFAKTRAVAEDTIDKLSLDKTPTTLLNMLSVAPKGDTEFLTITVKSNDAYEARDIANQIARSLKDVTKKIKNVDNVQLVDDALLPSGPVAPKPLLNIAIALLLGVFVSVGVVFLIEYLDNTVKDPEELEKLLEVPVLGAIPMIEDKKKTRGGKRDKRSNSI
ncbi:YveK family protein [Clostridium intestinale]|uniref:Capsular polysaccharide biosynthesis protein n=1 Tax=Clostridium intestinale DSM 6191 TaxID=1121320 RepID=A0A1M6DM76_9CLOT|nr:Wzz/FepE/Etk N-terminal domain-containing protein [Clostridium intestinale]SHI74302.1 Capsular polysaccharide biosynthesis protein [Clostridium intestinale DSM 6191]